MADKVECSHLKIPYLYQGFVIPLFEILLITITI